jgi:hypothetical protein
MRSNWRMVELPLTSVVRSTSPSGYTPVRLERF